MTGLVLDLLQLEPEEVPHEEVSVDGGVAGKGEWAVQAVEDEVSELVGPAYPEALRVYPDHRELVKKHLEVDEGVHSDLSGDE